MKSLGESKLSAENPKRSSPLRKKPRFIRQERWRYRRLESSWRRPRGKTSKMRREKRGWPRLVNIGCGKPLSLRGIHPSGYRETIVSRPSDLMVIDPKKEAVRIAGNVGERKRLAIIEKARQLEITILNPVGIRKPEEEKEEEATIEEGEKAEAEEPVEKEPSVNNKARVEIE